MLQPPGMDPDRSLRPARPGAEHEAAEERQWLLDMAAGGSRGRKAWGELFKRYRPRLLRDLRREQPQLAKAQLEDVVQDVAVVLYEKAVQFDSTCLPRPWIWTIAKNRVRDLFKSHANSRVDPVANDDVMEDGMHQQALLQQSPRPQVVPQQVIDECRDRRWRAYALQNPRSAEAIYLCAVEGWTMAELADFLGMTEGSAKVFVHRERAKIRHALAPCETESR